MIKLSELIPHMITQQEIQLKDSEVATLKRLSDRLRMPEEDVLEMVIESGLAAVEDVREFPIPLIFDVRASDQ